METTFPGPAPAPRSGTDRLLAPLRSLPHHLSNGLDNKRRAGAEKWGRGDSKSSKSFRGRGCVLLSPPSSFCEFLEVTPELAPDVTKALTTHTAAQAFIHTSAPRSRYTKARTAPPLFLPNSPSDGANRGERCSPAPLPWKSQCSHRQPPPPALALSLGSPCAGQSRLRVPINSRKQPGVTLPSLRRSRGVRKGWEGA